MIMEMTERKISMKVTFVDPQFISMSSQTVQDRLKVELTGPLIYGKNGLPLSKKRLNENANGDLET